MHTNVNKCLASTVKLTTMAPTMAPAECRLKVTIFPKQKNNWYWTGKVNLEK